MSWLQLCEVSRAFVLRKQSKIMELEMVLVGMVFYRRGTCIGYLCEKISTPRSMQELTWRRLAVFVASGFLCNRNQDQTFLD